MIIIIPNIKYGSTYYNTFTMGVCSIYHGFFFFNAHNIQAARQGETFLNFVGHKLLNFCGQLVLNSF